MILRERFDENKYERDQRKIFKIMEGAEREFEKMKHPFPYTRKCLGVCFNVYIRCKTVI